MSGRDPRGYSRLDLPVSGHQAPHEVRGTSGRPATTAALSYPDPKIMITTQPARPPRAANQASRMIEASPFCTARTLSERNWTVRGNDEQWSGCQADSHDA
jgi:hypothetical protein